MPKVELSNSVKCLFVGTSEAVAKTAPMRGLESPVFLTDTYPGYFAAQAVSTLPLSFLSRWGILEIDIDSLSASAFVPFPAFIAKALKSRRKNLLLLAEQHKDKWQQSLANCGVCLYLGDIMPTSICRVSIYTPNGKEGNKHVTSLVTGVNPSLDVAAIHKERKSLHVALSRWLAAYPVTLGECMNGQYSYKRFAKLDEQLTDRTGVDMYYARTLTPTRWK